jgi:hypothetical protein
MTNGTKEKIDQALTFFGIIAKAEDCDVCEDGSVWRGLFQVLPVRSVQPE